MPHKSHFLFRAAWPASLVLLLATCGRRQQPIDASLDRAETLTVILEGIRSEADADAAAPHIADWNAGWELHGQRTAGLESVSGADYVSLLRSRSSRSDDLRTRLQRQLDRLPAEPYLGRYRTHMRSALRIIPPRLPASSR